MVTDHVATLSRPARGRKGRPPPHRYRPPRLDGYSSFGLGRLHDRILPDIRGRGRREFFNNMGDGTAVAIALTLGAAAFASSGIVAGILAAAISYAVVESLLVQGRFIRR